jgi:hypothetical protein
MLTEFQIQSFIQDGFVKIDNAFSKEIASECCDILWSLTGCLPNDPTTWKNPVVRIGELTDPSFVEGANTPTLLSAYNQLVGEGNWVPKNSVGSFPIRFPSSTPANDTGWHVDASFPGEDLTDYMSWRINVHSKGRGLLMLFLFSDVGENDAPTLLKVGSHKSVARLLAPYQESGLAFMELAEKLLTISDTTIVSATGKAGTVYLCHPFIAHAAQDHKGVQPKFMAQPALMTQNDLTINKEITLMCPVEKAIWEGLQR